MLPTLPPSARVAMPAAVDALLGMRYVAMLLPTCPMTCRCRRYWRLFVTPRDRFEF